MPILFAQTAFTGVSGLTPNIVFINTNDTVATVTTAGYLNKLEQEHLIDLANGYMALVNTRVTPNAQPISSWFAVSITGTPGNFTYSLVTPSEGGGAIFAGNVQAGLNGGPAGAFISYPNTINTGRLTLFSSSSAGTFNVNITNASFGQTTNFTIPDPGQPVASFILSDSAGTQNINTGNLAVLTGNLQGGSSGHAGTLALFSGTASKGNLLFTATANTGNTVTTVTNAAMGQITTLTMPDPGGAAGSFNISPAALVNNNLIKASGTAGLTQDAGFFVKANTTATYAGGATSNTFTATGLTATSIVTAVNLTSTNSVAITKAVPGTNTLAITWSADPGAGTTVSWIATSAAV